MAACEHILACRGRVVVIGMGKSGHIGSKIAATLASTGSPAFFVHPGEASHGDLGMITAADVVLALSNSGETHEIVTILPLIKRMGAPLISMTGKPESTLAREADVNLDVGVAKEACPLDLAPTASTTAALVMGDAMAIALLEARGLLLQPAAPPLQDDAFEVITLPWEDALPALRIFDDIVQQRRDNGHIVERNLLRDDHGHSIGMRVVGFSRYPAMLLVRLQHEIEGAGNEVLVQRRQVAPTDREKPSSGRNSTAR